MTIVNGKHFAHKIWRMCCQGILHYLLPVEKSTPNPSFDSLLELEP
jgi:hypothetical protein